MRPNEEELPVAIDAERLVLGTILQSEHAMHDMRTTLDSPDFAIEKHRRIWAAMADMYDRAQGVDRLTLIHELTRRSQLESVDGMGYIAELDAGMPRLTHLDAWVATLKSKALSRKMIYAAQAIIDRCMTGDEPPEQILDAASRGWMDLAPVNETDFITLEDVAARVGLDALFCPRKAKGGLRLPWPWLDRTLCGLLPGQLAILAGATSTGKTSAAVQVAAYAAMRGETVVIDSLEMTDRSLYHRAITQEARIDGELIRQNVLTAEDRQAQRAAFERLSGRNLFVLDNPGTTVAKLRAKLRKLSLRQKLGLVILDYLQLLSASGRNSTRAEEVGANARALKLMAGEFSCPFLVLSQFSREHTRESREPRLSDLKESGDIENHADVVWFIHAKAEVPTPIKPVRFIVAKQREGPRNVYCEMVFLSNMQRFEEAVGDEFSTAA